MGSEANEQLNLIFPPFIRLTSVCVLEHQLSVECSVLGPREETKRLPLAFFRVVCNNDR